MDKIKLYSLITVHHLIILGVVMLPIILIVLLMSPILIMLSGALAGYLGFRRTPCPLTTLENKLRTKVGMTTIKTFVKHYYIKPVKRYLKKRTV